tara:strand:- start:629 stop:1087 length:459 start_codon:yes stop_codon:yes gene_type:complete
MAHFAKLDENNIVTQVIVVSNTDTCDMKGNELEIIGIAHCQKTFGADSGPWKQTSYNAKFGKGLRGNYAGIGYTYMENVATMGVGSTDIFIEQQPYASWTIGIMTAAWYPPTLEPELSSTQMEDGYYYKWDESAYEGNNNNGWTLAQYTPGS